MTMLTGQGAARVGGDADGERAAAVPAAHQDLRRRLRGTHAVRGPNVRVAQRAARRGQKGGHG